MRVAINAWFWDRPTTGSGQYTRRLAEHLLEITPELQIVLVAPEGQIGTSAHRHIDNLQLWPAASRYRLPPDLDKVWFEQVTFPRACRHLRVDAAHVPYWAPPLAPLVPTVVTIHDLIPLLLREYRGGPLVRLYTALVSTTAQNAALALTDSEASRRDIVAHLGLPDERVRVVHLAADEQHLPLGRPSHRRGVPAGHRRAIAGAGHLLHARPAPAGPRTKRGRTVRAFRRFPSGGQQARPLSECGGPDLPQPL
jgi:hypothetical protein